MKGIELLSLEPTKQKKQLNFLISQILISTTAHGQLKNGHTQTSLDCRIDEMGLKFSLGIKDSPYLRTKHYTRRHNKQNKRKLDDSSSYYSAYVLKIKMSYMWQKANRNERPLYCNIKSKVKSEPGQNFCLLDDLPSIIMRKKISDLTTTSQRKVKTGQSPKLEYLRFQQADIGKADFVQYKRDKFAKEEETDNSRRRKLENQKIGKKVKLKAKVVQNPILSLKSTLYSSSQPFQQNLNQISFNNNNIDYNENLCKNLEVTFNIESTEPQQAQKEDECNKRMNTQHHRWEENKKIRTNHLTLQLQIRRIQRETKSKQMEYRSLIRSLSKESGVKRKAISTKMKEVLDELYSLKKTTRNL